MKEPKRKISSKKSLKKNKELNDTSIIVEISDKSIYKYNKKLIKSFIKMKDKPIYKSIFKNEQRQRCKWVLPNIKTNEYQNVLSSEYRIAIAFKKKKT